MFKKLWNWGVVGAAVFFLWGGGITFMTSNLFTLADVFYIAGAALLIAKFVTWEEHINKPLRNRINTSLIVTLIIGCVLSLAVWENHHLKSKAEQALRKAEEPKIAYMPTPTPTPITTSTPADSSKQEPPNEMSSDRKSHPPTQHQQQQKPTPDQKAFLSQLTHLYIMSHDGISSEMMSGLQLPPEDWLNEKLQLYKKAWRMKNGRIVAITPINRFPLPVEHIRIASCDQTNSRMILLHLG